MIYLDNAATSLQKPLAVYDAVSRTMRRCASPGRGGYAAAMEAAEILLSCREEAARLFHAPKPENIVFTFNATHALNIAIRSLVSPGERVVISGYEHNAVLRPLHALGAEIDAAVSPLFDREACIGAFRKKLPGAKAAVCTHVSNVFGFILPVEEIASLCREANVPLIVDASQSAGSIEVDITKLGCAFCAMPGHKGLFGPQGTGLLLCASETKPLLFGGTGSLSRERDMPELLPDRLEAGTHNVPGIAGLLEGLRFVNVMGTDRILAHERELLRRFREELGELPVESFFAGDETAQSGVLSLIPKNMDVEELAERLGREGVAVRAGLHCAPLAHESVGTVGRGTVRFSFSPFNSAREIREAGSILKKLLN